MNIEQFTVAIVILVLVSTGVVIFTNSFEIVEQDRADKLGKFEKCAFVAEVTSMINFHMSHCDYDGNLIKEY